MSSGATIREKKPFVRRVQADRSQLIRESVQWLFVALNLLIGIQFYLWVHYYESGGAAHDVPRPPGVEGWLPIAGFMNFKYLLGTGHVPAIHPAAMFLFIAFSLMSLLLKKAFCSWICPVGTLSEHLWKLGRRIFRRSLHLPRWVDLPLRGLKYLLLGFFAVVIGSMSAQAIGEFMHTSYGLIADVKMLNFFREIGSTGVVVIAVLALLSVVIENFWCRYLCPYGALMGLASLLSPMKIRRDAEACIECGKCSKACPAHLPVDRLVQIRSVECTACLACVASCSTQDALQFALPPRRAETAEARWHHRIVSPIALAGILAFIFLGAILYARATGHWQTPTPRDLYFELVPHADEATHPGMN